MATHETRVDFSPGPWPEGHSEAQKVFFQASCCCGWEGYLRDTRITAQRDAEKHQRKDEKQ